MNFSGSSSPEPVEGAAVADATGVSATTEVAAAAEEEAAAGAEVAAASDWTGEAAAEEAAGADEAGAAAAEDSAGSAGVALPDPPQVATSPPGALYEEASKPL